VVKQMLDRAAADPLHMGVIKTHLCEHRRIRVQYDQNPGSVLDRLRKWHIGRCPGWDSCVKPLPDKRRMEIREKDSMESAA